MRWRIPVLSVLIMAGAGGTPARGQVSYTLVAQSGQVAPGSTRQWGRVGNPVIAPDGRVAFDADFRPGFPVNFDGGIWAGTPGNLSLVTQTGDAAPGLGNVTLDPGGPNLNGQGQILYAAGLSGEGVTAANDSAVFLSNGSGPGTLVFREGAQVPGAPAGTIIAPNHDFFSRWLAPSGTVAFTAPLQTPSGNRTALFSGRPGQMQLLAREGDPVPGLPGEVFHVSLGGAVTAGGDNVLFHAVLRTTTAPETFRHSLWYGTPGAITPIALVGQPAPVGDPQVTYAANIFQIHGNSAGEVAFLSQLARGGTADFQTIHLFAGTPGNLSRRVSEGDPTPGVPGMVFNDIDDLTLNRRGDISFFARIQQPGNPSGGISHDSLWQLPKAGDLRLIVRENQPAPGVSDGATFGDVVDSAHFTNGVGQLALATTLRGPAVNDTNDVALFATTPAGELVMVAREGSPLPGQPGGKVVSSLFWTRFRHETGGEEGLPATFNDAGQLAFELTFADGSTAVYIAQVPEPAALGLLLGTLALLGRHRTRTRRVKLVNAG
jgi:hypothetical protein